MEKGRTLYCPLVGDPNRIAIKWNQFHLAVSLQHHHHHQHRQPANIDYRLLVILVRITSLWFVCLLKTNFAFKMKEVSSQNNKKKIRNCLIDFFSHFSNQKKTKNWFDDQNGRNAMLIDIGDWHWHRLVLGFAHQHGDCWHLLLASMVIDLIWFWSNICFEGKFGFVCKH